MDWLVGQTFGKLTVLVQRIGQRRPVLDQYVCLCVCGEVTSANGHQLRNGMKETCGCSWKLAHARNFNKHGLAGSRIYWIWQQMLFRCNNPKHKRYADYGGRGIKVCDRWLNFENFFEDMGHRPEGKQLDRIHNNKDYEPSNCHWTTPKRNNLNKRNTLKIQFEGREISIRDLADLYELPYEILRSRVRRKQPITAEYCQFRKENPHVRGNRARKTDYLFGR